MVVFGADSSLAGLCLARVVAEGDIAELPLGRFVGGTEELAPAGEDMDKEPALA